MRPFISLVSCVAFLLHMWAGCCSHHAHAAEGNARLQQSKLAAISFGERTDVQSLHAELSPDAPSSGDRCSESQCVSLVAGKVELSKMTMSVLLPVCLGQEREHLSALQSWDVSAGGVIALPVRLHLYNQVLLI